MSNKVEIKFWVNLLTAQFGVAEANVSVWLTNEEHPLGTNLLREAVPAQAFQRVDTFLAGLRIGWTGWKVEPMFGQAAVIGWTMSREFLTEGHTLIVKRLQEALECR